MCGKAQLINQLEHLPADAGDQLSVDLPFLATVAHISHRIAPVRKEAAPRHTGACHFN
jgi:hypothetical protein